jgi:ribosome-associated toxin RatA of RatAB toxin-antitoxin module
MAKIFVSTVVDAPAAKVWEVVRDFNGLPGWIPAVSASEIRDGRPADQLGSVRLLTLGDDAKVVETLLALSDTERSVTYDIVESPLGVESYVATLSVTPVTDGDRSFVQWTADFEPAAGHDAAERVDFIGTNVFQAGFDSLKEKVRR